MTEETLTPIFKPETPDTPIGRRADMFAAGLAGLGAVLSGFSAIWFFIGFAENDTRLEHLTSALVLTLLLFAFAIVPFALVTHFARQAYQQTAKRAHLFWTLFLMLPWVGLGTLTLSHTPLPIWCGLVITLLAVLLCIWAVASLILDRDLSSASQKLEESAPVE